jgi:hypothetical protein
MWCQSAAPHVGSRVDRGGTAGAQWRLNLLWSEMFPAEQARIVRTLVERVEIGPAGADIRLRVAGLTSLVRELGAGAPDATRAAA